MNITPINAVSFKGKWAIKDIRLNPDLMGGSIVDFNRILTYHPDTDESQESIQAALKAMRKKFSGENKITSVKINPHRENYINNYKNIVKLGERLLSEQSVNELEIEQASLRGMQAQTTQRLSVIAELLKLKPISKKALSVPISQDKFEAGLKTSAKNKKRRTQKIAELKQAFEELKPQAKRTVIETDEQALSKSSEASDVIKRLRLR